MTSFHEVRFPDNIAYGATGGPEFATTVVATGAGHEKRNIKWAQARGRWDVASGLKKQAQIDELIAFFRARRGRAYEVKRWTRATRRLELWSAARLPLEVGDRFRVSPGCHKRVIEDCRDKFRIQGSLLFADGNARNFRGEPYIPGSVFEAPA